MSKEVLQDERFSIVEDALFDAIFLILKDKPIDKITVSDVIKKAGIVRSTFYNHYENVPDLISAIEDKTLHDIFDMMEVFHPKNDYEMVKSFYLMICGYTSNNPIFAELLASPRSNSFFEKSLTMFHQYVTTVTKRNPAIKHSEEEFSYAIASAIGATIGVLHKWVRDDCQVPTEHIADLLTKTFIAGMLPFIS